MSATARNALIIVAIAAAVAFLPGGGESASFIGSALSIGILAAFVLIGVRLYREHRTTIFGLGDRHRAMLYGALAAFVVAMAARDRLLDTGPGTVLWIGVLAGCVFALVTVWRSYREYSF